MATEDDSVPNPAEGVFSEVGGVAVAAILNMFRLVGGELVLLRSKNTDPKWFEDAVRKQLDQFTSPSSDPDVREAGLACARYLVERVLNQIRAQAEIKKTLGASQARTDPNSGTEEIAPKRFLLN